VEFYISKNGQRLGPFSLEEVNRQLNAGSVLPSDLGWQTGMADWKPLREISGITGGPILIPSGGALPGQPGSIAAAPTEAIPNHLVMAILVTLFCCLPFGIVAIVYAAQVNGKVALGDIQGAQKASRSAKIWSWWALGVGIVIGILFTSLSIIGSAMSTVQ
jgi:hypothetical protein